MAESEVCICERECPEKGGSCRVSYPLVLVGMRLKSVAQSRAERSVVDGAADLKQEISTSSGPAHLLRFVHSPIDEKARSSCVGRVGADRDELPRRKPRLPLADLRFPRRWPTNSESAGAT